MLAADMGAAFDVNGDDSVTIGDAWCIVKLLSAQNGGAEGELPDGMHPDVNGDGSVTLEDLRLVVNHLAGLLQGSGELADSAVAEGEGTLQANDDSYSVVHDIPHAESTSVLDNDVYDLDPMIGYALGVVSGVNHGALTLWSDGKFDYDPDDGFTGIDFFVYELSQDGQTSQATVILDVYNTPPVGSDKQYELDWMTGQLDVDSASGLLSDAYDDDAIVDTVSAVLASDPQHGSLTAFNSDGSFSYVPGPSFSGGDNFVFHVTDGVALSPLYWVQIEGGGGDQPVVAVTGGKAFEGNSITFHVTVALPPGMADIPAGQSVVVEYSTSDGTGPGQAQDGDEEGEDNDFVKKTGTLSPDPFSYSDKGTQHVNEPTRLLRDDAYEEMGSSYQCVQVATLDASLQENGVTNPAVRQAICESFLFAMGELHDQGWLKPTADSAKVYPLLCFTKRFLNIDTPINELGDVFAPSTFFAFHEYAHGNAALLYEGDPNAHVETGDFEGEEE